MRLTRLKNGNTRVYHDGKHAIWCEREQRFIYNGGVFQSALEEARKVLCRRR